VKLPEDIGSVIAVLCRRDTREDTVVTATVLPPGMEEAAA
jgi:hypothetical protein